MSGCELGPGQALAGPAGWREAVERLSRAASAGALAVLVAAPAGAAPVARTVPAVGEIVSARGDEQVRFVEDPRSRPAEVTQPLATGDGVQTGPNGGLAIVFHDATQIRVHRNTTLLVKSIGGRQGASSSLLRLDRGSAWSRARTVPRALEIETPAATAGIRGTDWHLQVEDDGRTTLTVLFGAVDLGNALGAVTVTAGEVGFAAVGAAPVKTFLVAPRDWPYWQLAFTPDWIRLLPVTGRTTGELRDLRARLAARVAALDAGALLDLAEAAYELSDAPAARGYLDLALRQGARAPTPGRVRLLEALLAAQEGRYDEGDALFAEAMAALTGRPAMIALVGRFATSAIRGRADEAARLLQGLAQDWPGYPEPVLAAILFASYRGDQAEALARAEESRRRFPVDTRFLVWLAHLRELTDDLPGSRAATEEALRIDPSQYLAWVAKARHHLHVDGDLRAALAALRRAIELVPRYAPAWNELTGVHRRAGDFDGALAAIQEAMRLAPNDAIYPAAYAYLLLDLERVREAAASVQRALALGPDSATALLARGVTLLQDGRPEDALEWILKATAIDPGWSDALVTQAAAHYHARQFAQAERTIANAIRLNPDDPVPLQVGYIMALDQAEAGRAIRLAREAADRLGRFAARTGSTIPQDQSGRQDPGSAYANLGLGEWADHHASAGFHPAQPHSHFFLSTIYGGPSTAAGRSEVTQGLLLDPLAVSARTRDFDFRRQPFDDLTVGAGVGVQDGAISHSEFATLQGFHRSLPVAYFVGLRHDRSDGTSVSPDTDVLSGTLAVGVRVDHRNDLLLTFAGSSAATGLRGTTGTLDDRRDLLDINGSLGYHHRVNGTDHVLARVAAGSVRDRFRSDTPLGVGVSDLSRSLIERFGVDGARRLYRRGICDATDVPFIGDGFPTFLVQPLPVGDLGVATCAALGRAVGVPLPLVPGDIPRHLDVNPFARLEVEQQFGLAQVRHLFEAGPVRATYGAEWRPARSRAEAVISAFALEDGSVVNVGGINQPFGRTVIVSDQVTLDQHAAQAYVLGDVTPVRSLRLEAGLFLRHFAVEDGPGHTRLDPRAGLTWTFGPGHALRVAAQRELVLPIVETLAPIGAVNLVPREDLTGAGGSTTTYQARWEAEWLPRLFTLAGYEHQVIEDVVVPVPLTLDPFLADRAHLHSAVVAANAWLAERWGVFARHRWTWTENRSPGHRGNELPLVPERTFDAGVTWVHPLQLRVTGGLSYVGQRPADLANSRHLDGYWTVAGSVNWQPLGKALSITLSGQNLLDTDYDLARGLPAPGPSVFLTIERRF